jgi:TolA-binding protein
MEEIQRKKEEKERLEREKWLNDLKNKEQAPAADKSEIEGQEVINLTPAQEEIKEEAAAPEATAPEEITTWVSFSALLSIKTAKLLKEFLDNNNIEFKRI